MYRTLLGVLLLLALAATAQPPRLPLDEPSLELNFDELVEVSEVLLDVLATDAGGRVVAGLGKEDFIVEENGEPVELTGVSYYSTRYGAEYPEADGPPASRHFIFFFHNQWQMRQGSCVV